MFVFLPYFFENFFLKNKCRTFFYKNNPENGSSVYKSAAFAEI